MGKETEMTTKDDIDIYLALIDLKTEEISICDMCVMQSGDFRDDTKMYYKEQQQLLYIQREMLKDKIREIIK